MDNTVALRIGLQCQEHHLPPHTHTTHCHYSAGAAGGLETIINFQLSFDLHLALSLEMPFITCQKCKLKTFLFLTGLCFCSLLFYFSNESVCMFPIIGNKELTRVFTHELAHLSGPHLATDFFFFFKSSCVWVQMHVGPREHTGVNPLPSF